MKIALVIMVLLGALGAEDPRVRLRVVLVGGPKGPVEHGQLAYVEIEVKNQSSSDASVPLAPRALGKGASPPRAPGYISQPGTFYNGFVAASIRVRFGDNSEHSITLSDVPLLRPGGYITLAFVTPAPSKPGKYPITIEIDNRQLAEEIDGNDIGSDTASSVFLHQTLKVSEVTVE